VRGCVKHAVPCEPIVLKHVANSSGSTQIRARGRKITHGNVYQGRSSRFEELTRSDLTVVGMLGRRCRAVVSEDGQVNTCLA
jgi:hypothetical protein